MLRHFPALTQRQNSKALLSGCRLLVVFLLTSSPVFAAPVENLDFTEDFSTTALRDSDLTNANWSVAESQVVMAWKKSQKARTSLFDATGMTFSAAGTGLGSENDTTDSVVLGDVDGDGDLDLIAGNHGVNKLYISIMAKASLMRRAHA